jgi:AbrB family looped-hinge helix DNA binding protein
MGEVDTTRLSSRGQVVLPKALRERLGLHEGEILAVYGEGDTVVLKRLQAPALKDMKKLHARMSKHARTKGIKPEDVERAIAEHRRGAA